MRLKKTGTDLKAGQRIALSINQRKLQGREREGGSVKLLDFFVCLFYKIVKIFFKSSDIFESLLSLRLI